MTRICRLAEARKTHADLHEIASNMPNICFSHNNFFEGDSLARLIDLGGDKFD